jgi:hypothetical protein
MELKEMTMSIDVEGDLMDHEARYEYLSQLDEAWELCRLDVEHARADYETALESGRATYEERLAAATSEHRRIADEAWAAYRHEVQSSGSGNRREAIAAARRKFNSTVASNRSTYNQTVSKVRDEYSSALATARSDYEHAVEDTFGHHRAAVQMVHHYLEPAEDQSLGSADGEMMPVTGEEVHRSGPFPGESLRADPHPATGVCHPELAGGTGENDSAFVDWLADSPSPSHTGAAA